MGNSHWVVYDFHHIPVHLLQDFSQVEIDPLTLQGTKMRDLTLIIVDLHLARSLNGWRENWISYTFYLY